ncbi:MAG: tyrosine-type recombinase/integrase [Nanoarchaeota archaeon]
MDIHNYKRRLDRTLKNIKKSKEILEENKETILKFKNYLLSEGIGVPRIERCIGELVKYSKMLKKPFEEATKNDIRAVIGELNQTGLAEETKKGFKVIVRKLYRFIEDIDEKGVYPERVRWISINIPRSKSKLPEELLTEEEIKKIIQKCNNPRDKALIATLAESGCRAGEIGSMQIKHTSFEEYGARLTVDGKTGMRKILVVWSSPYLQNWINQHSDNDNSNSPLWIKSDGQQMSYTRISGVLKTAAKKAGIKKRVHLHLLRHSRATLLASTMSEACMKQYLGWGQSSRMCGVYISMCGKTTDEAVLRANGVEIKKESNLPVMQPKKCIKCNTTNEATNRFCKICGLVLDKEEAEKIIEAETERSLTDNVMDGLIKDPEILELIKKKISL